MIIWGGYDFSTYYVNDGARYNASAKTWAPLPSASAPSARKNHTAVWTGAEMIIWGGYQGGTTLGNGASYSPAANSWTTLPTTNAPNPRFDHTAVWTGSDMIVWGGFNTASTGFSLWQDGARYNRTTNAWTALPTTNAPSARAGHTAVWTGSDMIVWGGSDTGEDHGALGDGGRYNAATDTWTALPTANAPSPYGRHSAIWTGTDMIIWGDNSQLDPNAPGEGARYDPASNTWTALPLANAPSARREHTAVWTGSEMFIWGGLNPHWVYSGDCSFGERFPSFCSEALKIGARYDPTSDVWSALPVDNTPTPRAGHTALWTGSDMIIWGGTRDQTFGLGDGARYGRQADNWVALPSTELSYNSTAVWTGRDVIFWGPKTPGPRFTPSLNSWAPLPANSAPSTREYHTAVWTGSDMIIWGGRGWAAPFSSVGDGARYSAAPDTWTTLPSTNAPSPRFGHTAVWTGSDMIIWGGFQGGPLGNGARYSPAANSWTTLPTTNAPSPRYEHAAVWTGSDMIVWGGTDSLGYLHDGARYNPAADTWTALPSTNAPSPRSAHTAVWNGSDMIIWGGYHGGTFTSEPSSYLGSGARYSPTANRWITLPTTNAPSPRYGHTAVWTGSGMIIWGGRNSVPGYLGDGAQYNAAADTWTALPSTNAPSPRSAHTAVWTGSDMIIWGVGNGGAIYTPPVATLPTIATLGCPTEALVGADVICNPYTSLDASSWSWSAPGATPGNGTRRMFSPKWSGSGSQPVTLRVCNKFGCATSTATVAVQAPALLSPVYGALQTRRAGPFDRNCPTDGTWCFWQHPDTLWNKPIIGGRSVYRNLHGPRSGLGYSNDREAWDVSRYNNPDPKADEGTPVYAAAAGVVERYYAGDTRSCYGQVLIRHTQAGAFWFSGYLHMKDIYVKPGDRVANTDLIGYISDKVCSATKPGPHLHFVAYTGTNVSGGLRSITVPIQQRAGPP